MKVLHLVETFAPVGGAERYMFNQISLLADAGIENVVVYWNEHSSPFTADNYPVHYLPESGPTRLDRVQRMIEDIQPTLAYLHIVRDPEMISMVSRLKPSLIYMHDFYPVCPGLAKFYRRGQAVCNRAYGWGCAPMVYLRRCATARHPLSVYRIMVETSRYLNAYQETKRVLVGSNYMKSLLVQNGMEAGRIQRLPYFLQRPGETKPVLNDSKPPQLLFVGRLEAEKGLSYLLKALALVSQPYRLMVAGEGSLQESYKKMAQELGVAGQVDFLGWVSPERMKQIYTGVTCLVFPSIWPEPFGMVGLEAFHYSRPVIAFNVGGVSDWLKDGHNGYLVPSRDVKMLAERIESLLADPALATRLGANGYRFVDEHHRDETHLQELLSIFNSVLE